MNTNDPRITAYALGELDEREQAAFERELEASPEADRLAGEIRETAATLRDGFAAECAALALGGGHDEPASERVLFYTEMDPAAEVNTEAIGCARRHRRQRWIAAWAAAAAILLVSVVALKTICLERPARWGSTGVGEGAAGNGQAVPGGLDGFEEAGPEFEVSVAMLDAIPEGSGLTVGQLMERLGEGAVLGEGKEAAVAMKRDLAAAGGSAPALGIVPEPRAADAAAAAKSERGGEAPVAPTVVEQAVAADGIGGGLSFHETRGGEAVTVPLAVKGLPFSKVRKMLESGTTVPVAELINAFAYAEIAPVAEADREALGDSVELVACPWNGDHQLLLLRVQGRARAGAREDEKTNVAREVSVQVHFDPAQVTHYRRIGDAGDGARSFAGATDVPVTDRVVRNFDAGEAVTTLFEVVPAGRPVFPGEEAPPRYAQAREPGAGEGVSGRRGAGEKRARGEVKEMPFVAGARRDAEWLTVTASYRDPGAPKGSRWRLLEKPVTGGAARPWDLATEDFRFAAAVAASGMILRDSPVVSGKDGDDVLAWLESGLGLRGDSERRKFAELVRAARDSAASGGGDAPLAPQSNP